MPTIRFALSSCLAVCWMMLGAPAWAAVSLPEVVAHAVGRSPDLRVKMQHYLGAEADQTLARARFFPEVDLAHTYGRSQLQTDGGAGARRAADHWSWSLSVTQNLFNGFQTIYEARQQDHAKSAQYFQLLDVSEQEALAAANAFIDVARQRDLVAAARVNHQSHLGIHEKIRNKVHPASGVAVAAEVDLEQAGGRLALAESNLLTAEANLADVSARYARIVGAAPPEALARNFAVPSVGLAAVPVDAVPAARAASAAVSAARQSVEARRGAFLPRLDARARQDWGRLARDSIGPARSRATIELGLVVNLSRGGADKARLARASADLSAALAGQEKVCRETRQRLQMAQNDLDKLARKMDFLRQHALSSEKVRTAYFGQFTLSRRSLLDVLDSENEFYNARRALIDGEADLALARLRLLAARGQLLGALNIAPALPAPAPAAADRLAVGCGEPGDIDI